jgi:hypothetical protein
MKRSAKRNAAGIVMGGALAGWAMFAAPAQAQTESAATPGDLSSAIQNGTPILEVRPRYESADVDGAADAEALTVRTRLGWQTAKWNDLQALIEFEDVRQIGGGEYNDGVPPAEPFATIADPDVTELNRLQIAWSPSEAFTATLGRQRIAFDDQRFVGAVAWRQDEQTFDALRFDLRAGQFTATYAYLDSVNRIFAEELDWDTQSHLFNATYAFAAPFKLTAFAYLLDFDGGGIAQSNATYGVRATGAMTVSGIQLSYAASIAAQSDYGDNPNSYDAGYSSVDLTAARGPFSLRAGYESLEGEGANRRFITPLATLHAFQGWADVFIATPSDGVEDLYIAPTFRPNISAPYFSAPALTLVWHDFEAERTGADLGEEIDVLASASITRRLSMLIKYADYDGTGAPADTTRTWVGFEFKL